MNNDSKRREALSKIVYVMFAVVVLAFAFVLFRSLNPLLSESSDSSNANSQSGLLASIRPGETVLRRLNKQRVWISHFSDTQNQTAERLVDIVNQDGQHCQPPERFCVISVTTDRDGIELRYSANAPAQLPAGLPWFGGFVNPANGLVYDLWGRAYAFQNIDSLSAIVLEP